MKESSYLSVVLPTSWISPAFLAYVKSAHEYLRAHFTNYEVIVVLNGGLEEDFAPLKASMLGFPETTVLLALPHRHSREIAGYVGLEYAKGDFVFEVEHMTKNFPGALLAQAFVKAEEGNDIVAIVPERAPSLTSELFYRTLHKTSYVPINLETEHFRLVTRRALNALFEHRQRTKYRKLLYAYTGFRRATIVYQPNEARNVHREEGDTLGRLGVALDVFIAYSTAMVKVTLGLSLTFFALSILGGIYALVIYAVKDVRIEGWSTLMLFMSFGLSGIFLILSIVVKYLEVILHEVQASPLYVVGSVNIISHHEIRPHV